MRKSNVPLPHAGRAKRPVILGLLLALSGMAQIGGLAILIVDEGSTSSRTVLWERTAGYAPIRLGLAIGAITCLGAAGVLLYRRS